ncbi:MAG: hypothetical protein K8T90_12250 [Planctomycetes bacterium]|nr:hypothetical protein [Planctomycetota bacterium]
MTEPTRVPPSPPGYETAALWVALLLAGVGLVGTSLKLFGYGGASGVSLVLPALLLVVGVMIARKRRASG